MLTTGWKFFLESHFHRLVRTRREFEVFLSDPERDPKLPRLIPQAGLVLPNIIRKPLDLQYLLDISHRYSRASRAYGVRNLFLSGSYFFGLRNFETDWLTPPAGREISRLIAFLALFSKRFRITRHVRPSLGS